VPVARETRTWSRCAKNYARYEPLYDRSNAISETNAPFRVNGTAVLRFCIVEKRVKYGNGWGVIWS